jgi:hypothetical protein
MKGYACTSCGTICHEDWKYCPECGTTVEQSNEPDCEEAREARDSFFTEMGERRRHADELDDTDQTNPIDAWGNFYARNPDYLDDDRTP